jgi:peptidyl-prolyl cis-trans isomerase B (cyclophilin B)
MMTRLSVFRPWPLAASSARLRLVVLSCLALSWSIAPLAQTIPAARVNVLRAEERRAPTASDVSILRTAARSANIQTARFALRAMGRMERPDLIRYLIPALRFRWPETRVIAADAIGQAARGWRMGLRAPGTTTPATVLATLAATLKVEDEPTVRAAIAETIGRLPYRSAGPVVDAGRALRDLAASDDLVDRLGAAKALESLIRHHGNLQAPDDAIVGALRDLAGIRDTATSALVSLPGEYDDPLRDARVRRLAFEALVTAGRIDEALISRGKDDVDLQVRRLAMRAAATSKEGTTVLMQGLDDATPMVRLEALKGIGSLGPERSCAAALAATSDPNPHVALLGIDMLASCGAWDEAVVRLEHAVQELPSPAPERGWHQAAHAIVSLATAAPDRARGLVDSLSGAGKWQLRMYAAQAATVLHESVALRRLAVDRDDNVAATAIDGLSAVSGHPDDGIYIAALSRSSHRVVLSAALALVGTPNPDIAIPALESTLDRLVAEGHANSSRARSVLAQTVVGLGGPKPENEATEPLGAAPTLLNASSLRRLAGPRAKLTIRGVGSFDLALLTDDAPSTVLRFVDLAESGYYDGLTFHRVVPNLLIQGGSPGANEFSGVPYQMVDELGPWPHVRGTVGLATQGRDTGNGQFFINLVDNPRFDHEYTVFAQILNGIDIIDYVREGDVIDRVEIIP